MLTMQQRAWLLEASKLLARPEMTRSSIPVGAVVEDLRSDEKVIEIRRITHTILENLVEFEENGSLPLDLGGGHLSKPTPGHPHGGEPITDDMVEDYVDEYITSVIPSHLKSRKLFWQLFFYFFHTEGAHLDMSKYITKFMYHSRVAEAVDNLTGFSLGGVPGYDDKTPLSTSLSPKEVLGFFPEVEQTIKEFRQAVDRASYEEGENLWPKIVQQVITASKYGRMQSLGFDQGVDEAFRKVRRLYLSDEVLVAILESIY